MLAEPVNEYPSFPLAVLKKDVARKYWIDLEYQQTMLRSEMGWIRSLQDQLRSGELPW